MTCCEHRKTDHRGQFGEPHSGPCRKCDCKGPSYAGPCPRCGGDVYGGVGPRLCVPCSFGEERRR